MTRRRKYGRKAEATVIAVQLALDTDGFTYRKWGGLQTCKPGDWLVSNQGDVYTVDRDTFDSSYTKVSPGIYMKTAPVWAERAYKPGQIRTKEGVTHFQAGDYIVFNQPDGEDGYAVPAATFSEMYEPSSD